MIDAFVTFGINTMNSWWEHFSWLLIYAMIFVTVERITRQGRSQKIVRSGFITDLLHSFLSPAISMPVIIAVLAALEMCLSGVHVQSAAAIAVVPFWGQLLLALFVGDFVGYWRHRFLHTKFGWPFHAIHHSVEEMDWLSNDRVEYGESIVTGCCAAVGFYLVGFSPTIIALHLLLRRFYGLYLHSNLVFSYGPLNRVFASPVFHRWHHSADARAMDTNFAVFFSWIDYAFGTYFMPKGEFPHELGLLNETIPEDYISHITYPFRVFWQRLTTRAKTKSGG